MAKFEIVMPKLGESIIEATITRWLKKEGEQINEDDPIVEIATDKVDSEIPSPVEGILTKLLFKEGDVVPVGTIIAHIELAGTAPDVTEPTVGAALAAAPAAPPTDAARATARVAPTVALTVAPIVESTKEEIVTSDRFYSPLIRNIARQEKISLQELDKVPGSGKDGRLTKTDLLTWLSKPHTQPVAPITQSPSRSVAQSPSTEDRIIEMDRMRKLIADHMVHSVQTSPHVTSFVEVDMTRIVKWRDKVKDALLKRENEKITFTHIFIDAIARTLKEFPMVNASVDGSSIILKKNVNIGMAVSLPNGNLIVPVIRNADQKSLLGIVKNVNDIAERARNNKLQPDEIQGGTITLTNLGSFGTIFGTPIINQPQLAIVAVGSITKRPVVIESEEGDTIGIRHMMYLSLSYDHRVIDGALGGKFIFRMKELLEKFDISQGI